MFINNTFIDINVYEFSIFIILWCVCGVSINDFISLLPYTSMFMNRGGGDTPLKSSQKRPKMFFLRSLPFSITIDKLYRGSSIEKRGLQGLSRPFKALPHIP